MSQIQGDSLQKIVDFYINTHLRDLGRRDKTIRGYKETLHRLLLFLNGRELTLNTARLYLQDLEKNRNWKQTSINCEKKVIKSFCQFLCEEEYIEASWSKRIRITKIDPKKFDYVVPEMVEKLIITGTTPTKSDNSRNRKIKEETRLALLFMLKTGRRVGEVLKMTGEDLHVYDNIPHYDIDASRVKNRKELIQPIPIDMLEELKKRQTYPRLFSFTHHTANAVLKRGCRMLNIKEKLTCHSLRHIFASSMSKNGTPIQHVAELIGDTVEMTEKVYMHHDLKDLHRFLNSPKTTVKHGLTAEEIFNQIEQSVRSIGIERDNRVKLEIRKNDNELTVHVKLV